MVFTGRIIDLAIPRQEDLRCMVCNIVNPGNAPITMYPDYCRNELKYRKFLDEIPRALAAPKNFKDGIIYVIVTKDLFESPTFLHDCNALDIQIERFHPISDSIYKDCLLNTVEHKLLGQWNKVGQYLVEGSNFLNSKESVNAIELYIDIHNDYSASYAQLHMQAFNLQIPFLKLKDRDFQPHLVNVLPSLDNANVIKRWEIWAIKKEFPFANYEDLREYWRRMHGYTLPINEEGLLFYDVEFYQGSTMVYPEICLTSRQNLTTSLLAQDEEIRIYENIIENLDRMPLCR